jgi:hypothetical protein
MSRERIRWRTTVESAHPPSDEGALEPEEALGNVHALLPDVQQLEHIHPLLLVREKFSKGVATVER